MSSPVKTDRPITIDEIVNDVRARGDAALVQWSQLFDQTTANSTASSGRFASRMGCEVTKVYRDHGVIRP